jgi:hypothetical protein
VNPYTLKKMNLHPNSYKLHNNSIKKLGLLNWGCFEEHTPATPLGCRDDDNTSVVSEVHGKGRGPASVGSAKPSRITSLQRWVVGGGSGREKLDAFCPWTERTCAPSFPLSFRTRGTPTWDGSSSSMPLNEAWGLLLDAYVPFLLQEAEAAANFLLLYEAEPPPLQVEPRVQGLRKKQRGIARPHSFAHAHRRILFSRKQRQRGGRKGKGSGSNRSSC